MKRIKKIFKSFKEKLDASFKKEKSESNVFHSFNEVKSQNWKKWESQHSEKYKNIEKKFSNYQLINSVSMIKSIKKNKLSYKIIVANNRKLTFKKIKKKLTENRISSKNILHFY